MNDRGTITSKDVDFIKNILRDEDEFEEWMLFIQSTEPDFYVFTNDLAADIVREYSKRWNLKYEESQQLVKSFITAFLIGYLIRYHKQAIAINNTIKNDSKSKFDVWLDGLMPDDYYQYPTDNLDKKSSAYQAKRKHEEYAKRYHEQEDIKKSKSIFDNIEESHNIDKGQFDAKS
jgi:hypothetical protein